MRTTLLGAALLVGLTEAFGLCMHASEAAVPSKTPVVLELFTSEACSSCPPADRLLQSLDATQPFKGADLIVLSEHVDYWNDSGWIDPYSSKLFTARQQTYAEHFRLDGAYTPQVVVDGQRETVGGNLDGIRTAVAAAVRNPKIALTISNPVQDGNRLKFHLTSADLPRTEGPVTVYVALAENTVQSKVARGENGGRSLTHVAVVRAFVPAGTLKGGSLFSRDIALPLPPHGLPSGFRVIAFLQEEKSQKIVGATYQKLGA